MHLMLGKDVQVPVRPKLERLYADYKQAQSLLREDLVWSSDLEAIRQPLGELIGFYANESFHPPALTDIVQRLIATENDLTI